MDQHMTSGERPDMHRKPAIGVDIHVTGGLIGNGGGRCPVCGSETRTSELIGGWGAWLVCQECTLEFAWPLELNQEPTRLFQDAYEGGTALNAAKDFVDRVRLREAILKKPSLWFWTPAFEMTIQWLKENLRNGGQVLEVGCGLGFMLHELRNRGFEVKAIDVAKAAVDLNRRDGFKVWHGTVNSLPDDFGEFDAVVSMFMLHHLTDPLGFVRLLRRRWPKAIVSVAQYGPSNIDPERSRPPRTLTRWNRTSISKLMKIAGYDPRVLVLPSTGAELSVFKAIQRSEVIQLALDKIEVPLVVFRTNMRLMNEVFSKIATSRRKEGYVLLAFGRPVQH